MKLKLSVLDQSPVLSGMTPQQALQSTTELVKEVEKLGYHRFWVSEHHSTKSLAGSAPEVLVAHLAANTSHIRVGTGGVLLPHYSAYKVAEVFRVLESLYPNRIDLGVGRAPGGMPNVNRALHDGMHRDVTRYPDQLQEVIAYLKGEDPYHMRVYATPLGETMPELWLLGSSGSSAMLASEMGAPFMFAHFINGEGGHLAAQRYREYFRPSELSEKPQATVAVFAICAETEAEAERLAASLDLALLKLEKGEARSGFPTPEEAADYPYTMFDQARIRENRKRMVVGDPEQVKQQLIQMSEEYGAEEVMVNTITTPFEARVKSYQLIAEAFELTDPHQKEED
ncbi:LLM class flavin-dependent oxidoreductase [Bacillus tianshenii]|nr:LLM class flavin-dependent oxidoreductase [Bacillus tianshenii]